MKQFKTRIGNDNKEMKAMLLDRLAKVEYTDIYGFAIRDKKMVKYCKVEHAMDILPMITYCEPQATSKGANCGVRMWNSEAAFEIIKAYASEIIPICSVDEFENGYQQACAENGKKIDGYRGEWFERLVAKMLGGIRPEKRTAKCTESGDMIVNGEHIQLKLWNATITDEKTVNNFYSEWMAKQMA